MITENPWTIELDRNEYRLQQFKRKAPDLFNQHRNRILADIDLLRVDVTAWFENNKKQRQKRQMLAVRFTHFIHIFFTFFGVLGTVFIYYIWLT